MLTKATSIFKTLSVIVGALVLTVSAVWGSYQFIFKRGETEAIDNINKQSIEKKVDRLIVSDSIQAKIITRFDSILMVHLDNTRRSDYSFMVLEKSHLNSLTIINRLDEVIKYYEEKAEYEKKKQNNVSDSLPEVKIKIEKIR